MKAHTKEQIKVLGWSKELPPITETQKTWSINSQLTHLVYVLKNEDSCFTCGHRWKRPSNNPIKCPHCGNILTIPSYKKWDYEGGKQKSVTVIDRTWTHAQEGYTTIFSIVNGYQVMRHLRVYCYMHRHTERTVKVDEVVQDWISPTGKHTIVAHQMNTGMFGNGPGWVFFGSKGEPAQMDIKTNYEKYHINGDVVPRGKMLPVFKKFMYEKVDGITFISKIIAFMDYRLESIWKIGYYVLFKRFINSDGVVDKRKLAKYWPAIKICQRNKYDLNVDSYTWMEHVQDLIDDGKDIRNAHYVCPPDLRAAHQVYINRKQKEIKRRTVQALLDRTEELNKKYSKHVERFKDLIIQGDGFTIVPILDVFDMYLEGEKLHHCVFTSNYYEDKDSLILSARTENERLETIQVDIKKMTLVQVHGLMNKNSEKHNDIVVAINNHIPVIRKMVKQRRLSQSA